MACPHQLLLMIIIGFSQAAPALAQPDSLLMIDQALPEMPPAPDQGSDEVMTVVEVMPEYPGGQEELFKYLGRNVAYPSNALDKGIQGTVYVTFVVMTDGTIDGARIMQGVHPDLDNEAMRVVRGMPGWKPGMIGGKAVRVQYVLPIRFTIQDRKTRKLRK